MKIKSFLLAIIFCMACFYPAFSQTEEKFDFYTRGEYRPEIPRPQSILRFDVGDFHTTYAQMESVVQAIARAAQQAGAVDDEYADKLDDELADTDD